MKKIILSIVAFVAFWGVAVAQDINTASHTINLTVPEVAIIDIEPAASTSINMAVTAPTEAGNPLVWTSTNNTLWLNFSSTVSTGSKTRKVQVSATGIPSGITLKVATTSNSGGTGKGNRGTGVTTPFAISTTAADLVSGIKTSYTGDGSGNGYQLTYSLVEPADADYSTLYSGSNAITVTYTITAEN